MQKKSDKLTVKKQLKISNKKFESMKAPDLKKAVSILANQANRRVKSLQSQGLETPALKYVEKSGGKFTVKGKNLNELRHEYARLKSFMNMKTSTVSGQLQVEYRREQILKEKGIEFTEDESKKFWKVYREVEQEGKEDQKLKKKHKKDSDVILEDIVQEFDFEEETDKQQKRIYKKLKKNYIKREKMRQKMEKSASESFEENGKSASKKSNRRKKKTISQIFTDETGPDWTTGRTGY